MKTKHTPGPWDVWEDNAYDDHNEVLIQYKDGIVVDRVGTLVEGDEIDNEKLRADAKLISAAPDSLNANVRALACLVNLRELLRLDKSEDDFSDEVIDCIKELNSAIKKATD